MDYDPFFLAIFDYWALLAVRMKLLIEFRMNLS